MKENSLKKYFGIVFSQCSKDAIQDTSRQCAGKNSCLLVVDTKHFETPCRMNPGGEYLLLNYRCVVKGMF